MNITDTIRTAAENLLNELAPEVPAPVRREVSAPVATMARDFIVTTDRSGMTLHLTITEAGGMAWAVAAGQASTVDAPSEVAPMIAGALRLRAAGWRRAGMFNAAASAECMARNVRQG
jgi:hypothetical protein